MAFESLVPLDLAAARDSESFGRGSIGFDFWHVISFLLAVFDPTSE
jgi:hypothetical protein